MAQCRGICAIQARPAFELGTRVEFYHDGRGVTTGIGGTDMNYWEVTVGATLIPLPDSPYLGTLPDGSPTFAIRPEIRYDDADQPAFDFTKHSEVTASIDIFYRF